MTFDDDRPAVGHLTYGQLRTASADVMVSRLADDVEKVIRGLPCGGLIYRLIAAYARIRARARAHRW